MKASARGYRLIGWQLATGAVLWSVFYTAMLQAVFDLSWGQAAVESLVANALMGGAAVFTFLWLRYYQPGGDRFWFLVLGAIGASAATVFLYGCIMGLGCRLVENPEAIEKSRFLHGGFAFLVNAGAIWVSMQQKDIRQQDETEARQVEAERIAREAELLKLRHQLQPHFLFNSLNSINALIHAQPERARTMVHQLSTFLRRTLKAEEQKTILLKEELESMQLYLEIEKVRFGHRLRTRVEADDASREATLPALLLQPLMENAIKFGLYGTTGSVEITLEASVVEGMLRVEVGNPVDEDAESQTGTGFGLNFIRRRLHLIYGRNDLLATERRETTFTATIKIPQQP